MAYVDEDVPVYPSPEFSLSVNTRKAKFEIAANDLAQRISSAGEQQRALPDQHSKKGLGVAFKMVIMHQHRELHRRTKVIEFQKRTLQLRHQQFEFKKPRGKKSFYLKHVISDHTDCSYYDTKHMFHVRNDKGANVTGPATRGVLLAEENASGTTLSVEWNGINLQLDMNAVEAGKSSCVSARR